MANRHVKRCLTFLIIREIEMKTTMIYQLTPVRMAIIKKKMLESTWRKGNSCTLLVGMKTDQFPINGKQYIDILKN